MLPRSHISDILQALHARESFLTSRRRHGGCPHPTMGSLSEGEYINAHVRRLMLLSDEMETPLPDMNLLLDPDPLSQHITRVFVRCYNQRNAPSLLHSALLQLPETIKRDLWERSNHMSPPIHIGIITTGYCLAHQGKASHRERYHEERCSSVVHGAPSR